MRHSLLAGLSLAASFVTTADDAKEKPMPLVFACEATNDLFRTAVACGVPCARTESPAQAVETAPEGAGVLLLADRYPTRPLAVPGEVLAAAARKRLRLYMEFPEALPEREVGKSATHRFERAVVSSDFFGNGLARPPHHAVGRHVLRADPGA